MDVYITFFRVYIYGAKKASANGKTGIKQKIHEMKRRYGEKDGEAAKTTIFIHQSIPESNRRCSLLKSDG